MSDIVAPAKRQPGVALIVSLCLNVALIGLIAVAMWRTGMRPLEPREAKVALGAQALIRLVPAEKAKIEAIIGTHHQKLHELRTRALQARADSFRMLAASDFNAADFAGSLAAVQSADAALETETMKLTAESVAALTPAEREGVAGQMQKPDRVWLRRFFHRR